MFANDNKHKLDNIQLRLLPGTSKFYYLLVNIP